MNTNDTVSLFESAWLLAEAVALLVDGYPRRAAIMWCSSVLHLDSALGFMPDAVRRAVVTFGEWMVSRAS